MKVVTTFCQPSAVISSVKCYLSEGTEHLIVAKVNRIEVYSIQSTGLHFECEQEIWGQILSVNSVPIEASKRSNLVVMTDLPEPELIFISYENSGGPSLTKTKALSLYERSVRPNEFFTGIVLDGVGRCAVVSCYPGKLKFILLKNGSYEDEFDCSVPELNILAITFACSIPNLQTLAILHLDYRNKVQLIAHDLHTKHKDLSRSASTFLPNTSISASYLPLVETPPIMICVPSASEPSSDEGSPGGVLIVGGRQILYYELSSNDWQEAQSGKQSRMDHKKKSENAAEVAAAMRKQKEREGKKRKPRSLVDWPWSEVTACTSVGTEPFRYLLGDMYGRLAMLSLDPTSESQLVLCPLGETSPAASLTYLTSQVLYVGSQFGDSQLVRIGSHPVNGTDKATLPIPNDVATSPIASISKAKSRASGTDNKGYVLQNKGSYLSVLEAFKNIAPISDAVTEDIIGSGQAQIYTCSGGRNTGSLNIIRNGADFEELGYLEDIHDVTNIWALREAYDDRMDSHLLVSTSQSSHLLKVGHEGGLTQARRSNTGFSNRATLAVANISQRSERQGKQFYGNSSSVVQVTSGEMRLLEYDSVSEDFTKVVDWTARDLLDSGLRYRYDGTTPRDIVAASVNASQFLVALTGGLLVLLNMSESGVFQVLATRVAFNREICAVSCIPPKSSQKFTPIVAVSYWSHNVVELYLISNEFTLICATPELPSVPRSVMLFNFHKAYPHLLVTLGNGSLASFSYKDKTLSDQKFESMGVSPVSILTAEVDGIPSVYVYGDRVSVFSWKDQRLHQSATALKLVDGISRLHTEQFPSCIVLVVTNSLRIGRIKGLGGKSTHSVSFGNNIPRYIAYNAPGHVFGVACIQTKPARVGEDEMTSSSFRVLSQGSLEHLGHFDCEINEEITALESMSLPVHDSRRTVFCAGTVRYRNEKEPRSGRLLIFNTSSTASDPQLLCSQEVNGCVYALTQCADYIAAAINSSVVIYAIQSSSHDKEVFRLRKLCDWTHNYLLKSLTTFGDRLLLGDAISSVSVLKFTQSTLHLVAKDYGPLWPICVQAVNKKNIIGANADLNLFSFTIQDTTPNVLEHDGSFYIADLICKFLPGTEVSELGPMQLFFTSSGRIGLLVDIGAGEFALQMTALQRNMAAVIPGVGAEGHTKFRAPKNSRGRSDAETSATGFLDGDFVEQFLTVTHSMSEKILAGQTPAEQLRWTFKDHLETLRSMH